MCDRADGAYLSATVEVAHNGECDSPSVALAASAAHRREHVGTVVWLG
jgi:hypothetical protein